MHLYYNKLDENAEKRGLLRLENEQIKEVPGAASPYIQKELFAVTPCKTYFDSSTVSFTFDRNCYMDNTGLTVTRMEVKFGDESSYVNAQWGSPVSHKFSNGGEQDIYFRMTFSNGKSLISRTRITVVVSKPLTRADGTAMEITSYDIPATSSHSGGTMQVIFCNEATKGKYIRPLIIAEEADISWLTSDGDGVNLKTLIKSNSEFSSIISNLSKIYDIIYIDNKNGLDDINRNAALFKDVIDRVNGNLFQVFGSTVADSTYVVGLGMGGLVARVALNMMETNSKQHRVRKLITINTPYKGLNIPVGLQAFIRHIENFKIGKSKLGDLSEKVDQMESLINSKAMRQMLIYSLGSKLQYDNDEYKNFINSPNVIRTPLLCQTVAISGGSQSGKRLFSPESILIDYHGNSYMINQWFMNFFLFGNVNIKYDIKAITLPDRKSINIYDGDFYIRKRIFFWHVNINLSHKRVDANSNMYPIDGASGNIISLKQMKEKSSDLKEILKFDEFCFVPTTSALGLSNWEERLSSSLQLKGESSMCNRYYISGDNNESTNLIAFKEFLLTELMPKIDGNISGIWCDTKLRVDNMPDLSLISYTWNFKNQNFKIVSQKGVYAVVRPLNFGVKDIASVTVSIPFIGMNIDIPSVELSSSNLFIEGDTYISKLKNQYRLNLAPNCDTLMWRASEGVIIDSNKGNYVVAHTEKELVDPWIEAVVVIDGVETVFRKDLISKKLESVELICLDGWIGENDKGERCYKFAYMVNWRPSLPVDRLFFCWGYTLNKVGEDPNTTTLLPGFNIPPLGLSATLITSGDHEAYGGMCMPTMKVDTIKDTNHNFATADTTAFRPIVRNSFNYERPIDPLEPPMPFPKDITYAHWADEFPNRVVVVMPVIKDGKDITGVLRCRVSDYLGESHPVESKGIYADAPRRVNTYMSSPNPANSAITISRQADSEFIANTLSVNTTKTFIAALYNDFGMVRSITFDNTQTSVDMNVSDLANGTYYLNIIENGSVIERQVIFVKH